MQINKIDINKTWDYFNNSKNRNSLILKWGGVFALFFFSIWLMYFLFIFSMFGSIAALESNEEIGVGILGFMSIFGCVFYLVVIGVSIFLNLYIPGSGINNFRFLRDNYSDKLKMDDLPSVGMGKKLVDGFKYSLVNFVYMLPMILLYIAWYVVFVLIFMVSFSEDMGDEMPIGFLLWYLSLFVVMGIQFVYILVVQFGLRPVIYNKILDDGYLAAANPLSVIAIFKKKPKEFFTIGLYLLLPMLLWMAAYFLNIMLVYLCIGIFILPFTLGLVAIISVYIEPHILAQAFHKKK